MRAVSPVGRLFIRGLDLDRKRSGERSLGVLGNGHSGEAVRSMLE